MIEAGGTIARGGLFFLQSVSFVGILTITTLLVSFNKKGFDRVFSTKGFIYWSLFFVFSLIPLAILLFLWRLMFASRWP